MAFAVFGPGWRYQESLDLNHHFLNGGGGGKATLAWPGGWLERRKIKRSINICQTLKCKFPACGPVGTQTFIITFLGRSAKGGGWCGGSREEVGRKVVLPYLKHFG